MASVLLPVIKPDLVDEFLMIWDLWFVLENTTEDEKYPGKLKSKIILLRHILINFKLSGR